MSEHIGHIKNPLTVISRFAAIAEISGTAVLPFIAPENQATYIWFLMTFPVLLVGAFFLTLNFNHKTLYAPSDYKNQNHFLNLFGIVTPNERDEKLNAEVQEADATLQPLEESPVVEQPAPIPEDPPIPVVADQAETIESANSQEENITDSDHPLTETKFDFEGFKKRSNIESIAKLEYIEKRSIEKLRLSTNIQFSAKVKFDIPSLEKPLIFDAIADQGDTIHIAEVKYFDKQRFAPSRFGPTLTKASLAAQNIYSVSSRKVVLHLVVILNEPTSESNQHNIKTALHNLARPLDLTCRIYIATVDQLASGLMPADWTWK